MAQTEELVHTHIGSKYTDEQWELVFELKCYGYTYRELADWLGVSHTLVQNKFLELGCMSRTRPPLSTYDEKLKKLGDNRCMISTSSNNEYPA